VRKEGQQSKDAIGFRMRFIFVTFLRVVQGLRVRGGRLGLKVGLFPWFICKLIKFRGDFGSKIFKAISTLFLVAPRRCRSQENSFLQITKHKNFFVHYYFQLFSQLLRPKHGFSFF